MATVFPSTYSGDNAIAFPQETVGTVMTITNNATIPSGSGIVRVTTAGAVTGIILQAGLFAGQTVTVIHEGAAANTITFAAVATSNVMDGVADVLTGPSARIFVWDPLFATPSWSPIH
jgi:hypothetical protein